MRRALASCLAHSCLGFGPHTTYGPLHTARNDSEHLRRKLWPLPNMAQDKNSKLFFTDFTLHLSSYALVDRFSHHHTPITLTPKLLTACGSLFQGEGRHAGHLHRSLLLRSAHVCHCSEISFIASQKLCCSSGETPLSYPEEQHWEAKQSDWLFKGWADCHGNTFPHQVYRCFSIPLTVQW